MICDPKLGGGWAVFPNAMSDDAGAAGLPKLGGALLLICAPKLGGAAPAGAPNAGAGDFTAAGTAAGAGGLGGPQLVGGRIPTHSPCNVLRHWSRSTSAPLLRW